MKFWDLMAKIDREGYPNLDKYLNANGLNYEDVWEDEGNSGYIDEADDGAWDMFEGLDD